MLVKLSDHKCYSLSPFCLSTHVVNSLEHRKREDSDRKASIPLRESNNFMMPGCSSENPAAPLMWKNMASPQLLRLERANFYLTWSQVQIRRKKMLNVFHLLYLITAAALVNSERLHSSTLFLFSCPKRRLLLLTTCEKSGFEVLLVQGAPHPTSSASFPVEIGSFSTRADKLSGRPG